MANHLFSLIRSRMPAPETPFIIIPEAKGAPERTLTYGDVVTLSARMANLLVARGVKPGDRVAVQVEKSAEAIVLYLACVRAGAIYLPLNTGYTLAELDYFIGDATPHLVVCDPAKAAAMKDLALTKGVAAVETLGGQGAADAGTLLAATADQAGTFVDVDRGADDLAAILYTSGTTAGSRAPCSAMTTWPPTP
ncbi:AMP-binding protein, partial [Azospirillum sp. B4]|uniref:AMP-binding protein n=1 Tax=Azospirillum sp. B4 TaxID=95605 RepID=UPI001901A0B4